MLPLSQKIQYEAGELVIMKTFSGANLFGLVLRSSQKRAHVHILTNGVEREFSHKDLYFLNSDTSPLVQRLRAERKKQSVRKETKT